MQIFTKNRNCVQKMSFRHNISNKSIVNLSYAQVFSVDKNGA